FGQLRGVRRVDLVERREALAVEGFVVALPVRPRSGGRRRRGRKRCARSSPTQEERQRADLPAETMHRVPFATQVFFSVTSVGMPMYSQCSFNCVADAISPVMLNVVGPAPKSRTSTNDSFLPVILPSLIGTSPLGPLVAPVSLSPSALNE